MAGIFDLKLGAFDSTEAAVLFEAYDIALQGLRTSQGFDPLVGNRLARSIVKVARTEPDCLRNDGSIDPIRLAQRAILRMLQMNAPRVADVVTKPASFDRSRIKEIAPSQRAPMPPAESAAKVMSKIFERTPFAKL
jgi:hypothetical protein